MFQRVAGDGVQMLQHTDATTNTPACHAWPLLKAGTLEVRVIIINKDPTSGCSAMMQLSSTSYGTASVTRLLAPSLSSNMNFITLGGQSYLNAGGGQPSGTAVSEAVTPFPSGNGGLNYTVKIPTGSAAAVTIPMLPAALLALVASKRVLR